MLENENKKSIKKIRKSDITFIEISIHSFMWYYDLSSFPSHFHFYFQIPNILLKRVTNKFKVFVYIWLGLIAQA